MCFHHLHPSYHRLLGCPTLPSWTNQDLAIYGWPAQSNKIQIDKKNTQANWFSPHPLSCYQQLKECLISLIRCDIQHIKSSLLVRHPCSSVNQCPWFIISIGIYISIPIDTSSTLHRQSTNFCWWAIVLILTYKLVDTLWNIDQQSIKGWSSVNRYVNQESMYCGPGIKWDVDWDADWVLSQLNLGYWLTLDNKCFK